ncbi:MAG: hypothetical protein K9M49_05135 [Candidatus Marinimicrobia bacterium]|nr:hypothetical protein [Candidatus Neomarinimicrobiota bacterium]MCF7850332.1 hypothetical protein [Candidatus Neomarinimicrobiota bacterium]MCF7904520.1 hypothetical protein [Candidatus Neomarinimicrobiota bacterium]
MHRKINLLLVLLLIWGCDQSPNTLDPEPYEETTVDTEFELSIRSFEFDFFSRSFFAATKAISPDGIQAISAKLFAQDSLVTELVLNDQGLGFDIQAGDDSYDLNWTLTDSLVPMLKQRWMVRVSAKSNGEVLLDSSYLNPVIPSAPVIENVDHQDTLHLPASGLVFDTLRVTVSHAQGLDEIRDVSFKSLKPNGDYASGGNPIPLLDDGSQVILYEYFGVEITSGDKVEDDGIFSLTLPLSASDLTGMYLWTFSSRSWDGLVSDVYEDTLQVLAGTGGSAKPVVGITGSGAFQ